MIKRQAPRNARRYRVGIDVGTHSVGLAAIEVDDADRPVAILNALSHIHDSGVLNAKTAETRLAAAGVARRVRRMRRRRSKRLVALDRALAARGWSAGSSSDPYFAWRVRARLATEKITDPNEVGACLATALRHMARHRGWRNPYTRTAALFQVSEPSDQFVQFRERVFAATGDTQGTLTVGELAVQAIDGARANALRMGRTPARHEKAFSFLGGKLLQTDNANEIHAYARVQGLSEADARALIDLVFQAESPRGSWVSKIATDPLDAQQPRAPKASDAFQRFRIAQHLANIRVREGSTERPLTVAERQRASEYLLSVKPGDQPTWSDVARELGASRRALVGGAAALADAEERLPLRPPVHVTDHVMRRASKLAEVRDYWVQAGADERDALITLLVDGKPKAKPGTPEWEELNSSNAAAWELLNGLPEEALVSLDSLDLPSGRGAYSCSSLRRLTEHILNHEDDLHAARKAVFGVDDSWVPPSEPIGAAIGNPAVDRVTKVVARWLLAAEAEWGAPAAITIEHVRAAFLSAHTVQEIDRDNLKRHRAKLEQKGTISKHVRQDGRVSDEDVRRFEAVQRQNGQCLYCGDLITYQSAEMDHIVPRRGVGSTNTRTNLVAVCMPCNRSKSNIPFGAWAARGIRPGVSVASAVERTKHWQRDNGSNSKRWALFTKEVRERLERTEDDPEIDGRSMESVAWMANELRDRIASHFRDGGTKVSVYQGALTAQARGAAGIAERIPWAAGSRSKDRFDRRHHAVDACVSALLNDSVARTLAERISMRTAQYYDRHSQQTWREYAGSGEAANRFAQWRQSMDVLANLLDTHFKEDRVTVTENRRLRFGDGRVHEDTIRPFTMRRVGDAIDRSAIDAASTPALWTALTRAPDFDAEQGLPANPDRRIRVHGTHLGSDDEIAFFDKPRAALAVRGGWAELGDSIHHARIYRWEERGKVKYGMLRVFRADLLKHRHDDLFNVALSASSVSMRTAHPSIAGADLSAYEYVGWLVPGDELQIEMEHVFSGHVAAASEALGLGPVQRWTISGFMSGTQVSLVPTYLAAEGLETLISVRSELTAVRKSIDYVLNRWVIAATVLFEKGNPVVIRRDALGRRRAASSAGLPVCWSAR